MSHNSQCRSHSRPLGRLPTLELIRRIALQSDLSALHELIEHRRLFRYKGENVRLSELCWLLREASLGLFGSKKTVSETADEAYSLAIKKFINLPQMNSNPVGKASSGNNVKQREIDCRKCYKAIMHCMLDWRKKHPSASELDEERKTSTVLKGFVIKHFYLSVRDIKRSSTPFSVRYSWEVEDGIIYLWYPREVDPQEFRAWLEDNFGPIRSAKTEDRNQIQEQINTYFGRGRFAVIDQVESELAAKNSDPITSNLDLSKCYVLAKTVAQEKVDHIESLRPSIRKLGKKILYELILRIFGDLADEVYRDQEIARDFGLSKATFSRFAGGKWREKISQRGDVTVPDLWQNTARIVSSDPDFLDSARSAGLLVNIGRALGADESEQQNET